MLTTYTPILRNGRNEREVIREFNRSSLSGSSSRSLSMVPLLEITAESDLTNLNRFEEAGEYVMVDLPRYLTERSNKYSEDISETINQHESVVQFYLDNSDHIEIPVLSGSIDPVNYSQYHIEYASLQSYFDRIAVRLLLQDFTQEFTGDQRDALERLSEVVSPEDIILFDLVDNGTTDALKRNLSFLADLFSTNQLIVMNGFDAYNNYPDNESPDLAEGIGAGGFGDFGINQRFKPDGGGRPDTVKVRHYYPNHGTVREFSSDSYEEAGEHLTDWVEFRRDHCNGCRRADRTSNDDANTWSQIRMQHYFASVLGGEI